MAVTIGVNSWASIAEADVYFSSRLGATLWASQDDVQKERLMVTAFYWLVYDPAYTLKADTPPTNELRFAQLECTLFLLLHAEEKEKYEALHTLGVKEFTASKTREVLGDLKKPNGVDYALLAGGYWSGSSRVVQL